VILRKIIHNLHRLPRIISLKHSGIVERSMSHVNEKSLAALGGKHERNLKEVNVDGQEYQNGSQSDMRADPSGRAV
jgi:hypothetical protein